MLFVVFECCLQTTISLGFVLLFIVPLSVIIIIHPFFIFVKFYGCAILHDGALLRHAHPGRPYCICAVRILFVRCVTSFLSSFFARERACLPGFPCRARSSSFLKNLKIHLGKEGVPMKNLLTEQIKPAIILLSSSSDNTTRGDRKVIILLVVVTLLTGFSGPSCLSAILR